MEQAKLAVRLCKNSKGDSSPQAKMETDTEDELLMKLAAGGAIEYALWPKLREYILTRLDHIARNDFPIPRLPQPAPAPRLLSPLPSSPTEPMSQTSSQEQEANKENNPTETMPPPPPPPAPAPAATPPPGVLPPQIEAMVEENALALRYFTTYPPHTIQRLSELVLYPRRHYRVLASWLNAVDRVVHVTSGANIYPLPPAIPDMSSMSLSNGVAGLASSTSTQLAEMARASAVGSDEALGGALLTPISWLHKPRVETSAPPAASEKSPTGHAEIRAENTETIDGPNGMGTIETVSVSVNGIPSMGSSSGGTRGVTQGELLRQEQRAGVVPVSQLSHGSDEHEHEPSDEDEIPHARGPEEIGPEDLGPQHSSNTYIGGSNMEMQGIDVEAAVGRRTDGTPLEEHAPATGEDGDIEIDDDATISESGSKRDAEDDLDGTASKKLRETKDPDDASESTIEASDGVDSEAAAKPEDTAELAEG